jgi:hypothetical protein
MTEMEAAGVDATRKRVDQIGAVESAKRGPETRHRRGLVAIIERRAAVHVAGENAGRDIGRSGNPVAEPDCAQHLDRLRTDVDAGSDLAKVLRALKNLRLEAELGKGGRRC